MALDNVDLGHGDEERSGREFTLGTSTILGLFFCLALAFAAVFGLGYTVGRKSVAGTAPGIADTGLYGSKPPAGSAAIQAIPGYLSNKEAVDANANAKEDKVFVPPTQSASATPVFTAAKTTVIVPMNDTSAQTSAAPPTPAAAAAPAPPPPTPSAAPVLLPGSFIVQIAAVSHQEDADLLLSSLKARGYRVAVHTVPQDKLLHVQIGPFANRKDADAMRARLLADGYNAIVK